MPRAPLGERRFRPPEMRAVDGRARRAGLRQPGDPRRQRVRPAGRPPGDLFRWAASRRPSEDCLYLNVWTSGTSGAKRPVMVWCHGGAFITGSGSSPWNDGANLCRLDDVVVVSVQPSPGRAGLSPSRGHRRRGFAGAGTAGVHGHRRGARMGARQHRGVRRRSRQRDDLRRIGRRREGQRPDGAARRRRACSTRPSSRAAQRCRWPTREDGTRTARQLLARLGLAERKARPAARACRPRASSRRRLRSRPVQPRARSPTGAGSASTR